MWLLEINPHKAKKYAAEIYRQNRFSFDEKTGHKKQCSPEIKNNTATEIGGGHLL